MTFATGQGYKLTEVYTNGKLDPYASCRAAGEFFTTTWEAVDELIFVKLNSSLISFSSFRAFSHVIFRYSDRCFSERSGILLTISI